ncbi:MAG: DUF4876 domain-containing protein [Prevotella sp.]|nr:DUF4876 domain-containing protein [Prevotella sp.]
MTKKVLMGMLLLFGVSFTFMSCSDDDDVRTTNATISFEMPINLSDVVLNSFEGTLTNVRTGETFPLTLANLVKSGDNYQAVLSNLPEGEYNISAKGNISFTKDGIPGTTDFTVENNGVSVSQLANAMKLSVNSFTAEGGFILSEIFFTGTTTPEGNQYSGDQYAIITNNSDVTLYADSIAFLESQFLTTNKQDYTPDLMNEAFSVQAVYMIPGTGKSVPVEPGKSLVLAVNAINHKAENANSIDLTNADFEFYDVSSNPRFTDPDGSAPNLDKWYCYTATIFSFHNRGFRAYAIAKMQTSKEDWLENYAYDATYKFVFGDFSRDMTTSTFKVPNSWILDAVNLSIASDFQWLVTSAALDAGWTYCGSVDQDKTRYGKAVIRKQDDNGKYIDTNNSTNDFIPEATPSLLK